ncbi:sialic acid-binding Ig-like lectin 12 [Petromyzon marinus]|uniref:sialic acid-binding Ig-like lectin 12 n=1 Tax=Petromyzon marinus TaxID=7757 RepID=UPI003F6F8E9E
MLGAWCQDDGKLNCRSAKQGYQVCSRSSVEAVEGGSAMLPCTFSFPAHLQPSRVSVSWRSDMFRDSTVFQSIGGFVHESLRGRLSQKGDLGRRDASIFIRDIRIDDFKVYVCQVMLFDDKVGYEVHVSDGIELKLGIRCKSQGELSCRSTRLGYQVCARTSVEAVEGGSAMLPCTFSYPAHLPPSSVSVSWRPDGLHEAITFQSADPFLRENVLGDDGRGRFSLAGNLSTHNASISIRDLRLDDFKAYVCQPVMYYVNKEIVFQVSDPIKLKLKEHTEIPATAKTTTTAATLSAAPSPAATAQCLLVSRAPIHSVAAAAVLGWAALLLVLVLAWRRCAVCAKRRRARDAQQDIGGDDNNCTTGNYNVAFSLKTLN